MRFKDRFELSAVLLSALVSLISNVALAEIEYGGSVRLSDLLIKSAWVDPVAGETDSYLNVADLNGPFVGVIEHTNFIPAERYGGRHIVYLSNYLSPKNRLFHLSHEELLQEYLPHLQKINPDFNLSWVEDSYYHKVEAAQPIIPVNYSQIIPDHRTPLEGLYLANTTQIYPEDRGTNYSVRLGRKVARMVLKDHGHSVLGEMLKPAIADSFTMLD